MHELFLFQFLAESYETTAGGFRASIRNLHDGKRESIRLITADFQQRPWSL